MRRRRVPLNSTSPFVTYVCMLFTSAVIGGPRTNASPGDDARGREGPAARPPDARLSPYGDDPDHLWNRLHQALFVREEADGTRRVHTADPLLYRGGTFLLEGEPHRRAVALLDQLLAGSDERAIHPLKRLFFQRDLWAAFDYVAWYPDDWVHHSRHEPAAVALRNRLARLIGRLALDDHEIDALPDNYALAVKSNQYPPDHDPEHSERPFLPPNLFDPTGPWVRFHATTAEPMARQHFDGAGGRAIHTIFLRLPRGRATTERYLKELNRDSVKQFPAGTMVAMVRRALAVDRAAKIRVTPVTELVQIRVYRRVPKDSQANSRGVAGDQDVYEFLLDRATLFAGQHGLRAVGPDDPAEPLFERHEGADPFERTRRPLTPAMPQLKTCIECHQAPGIDSVLSIKRGLRSPVTEDFRNYAWDVEMSYTVKSKVELYNWGLLLGKLEAR
jgi:hypothetical protein